MTPGIETSEYKLTKYIFIAGILLDFIGIVLESLKSADLNFGWLPVVLTVTGTLMALVKALGYTRSRTMVKLAESAPKLAPEVAALVPLLVAAAKELKSGPTQLPLSGVLPPTPPSQP